MISSKSYVDVAMVVCTIAAMYWKVCVCTRGGGWVGGRRVSWCRMALGAESGTEVVCSNSLKNINNVTRSVQAQYSTDIVV